MKMTPDPRTLYVDRITFHIPDDDPDVVDDHSLLVDRCDLQQTEGQSPSSSSSPSGSLTPCKEKKT
ncbi:hypothetical protein DERP_006925 [Dermatophagoides pteronyssinus]|uniref:Uncharacterized protein n=1 Tax=Dermatophagoides pteronyssinus TaxID=6956 RepID=A0ABQ8ISE7_DERPT|nr:hypothetical protein DERP_006925 [Dermatophagoides pteronyssinus]